MKINPVGSPNFIPAKPRPGKAEAYKNSSGQMSADEVTLSKDALSFSKIFSEARETASVSRSAAGQTRIGEIKAQVDSGAYFIGSEALADSILGDLYG